MSCAAGERPVWNLAVAGQPEYFANGILVHNCVQAFHPHLGDGSPGTVRKWAGSADLDALGEGEDAAMRRRRRVPGAPGEVQAPEDAPWDLDGFAPGDEKDRPSRGNVRPWH